jgi:hypothetical protein
MCLCKSHHVRRLAVQGPQVSDQLVAVALNQNSLLVITQVVKSKQPAIGSLRNRSFTVVKSIEGS